MSQASGKLTFAGRRLRQDGTGTYVCALGLISVTNGSGVQTYRLTDGLGSTTELVDGSGNVLVSYTYDAFGAVRSQSASNSNDWLFTGEQRDDESGYDFLRARYYDAGIGRFLGRDPAGHGPNPYSYAMNSPLGYVDPSGQFPICGQEPPVGVPLDASGCYDSTYAGLPLEEPVGANCISASICELFFNTGNSLASYLVNINNIAYGPLTATVLYDSNGDGIADQLFECSPSACQDLSSFLSSSSPISVHPNINCGLSIVSFGIAAKFKAVRKFFNVAGVGFLTDIIDIEELPNSGPCVTVNVSELLGIP